MTTFGTEPAPRPKLPIWRTVIAAYGTVLSHPRWFILSAIPALIVIAVLWIVLTSLPLLPGWAGYVWQVIGLLPYILFGLIWLRLRLLETPGKLQPQPRFGPHTFVYVVTAGVIFLLLWLPLVQILPPGLVVIMEILRARNYMPSSTVDQVYLLALALLLPWSYLLARISVLASCAAADQPLALRTAWRATAGNGLRLICAFLLAGLLPAVLAYVAKISILIFGQGVSTSILDRAVADMITAPLGLFAVAMFAAVIAEADRLLTDRSDPREKFLERFD